VTKIKDIINKLQAAKDQAGKDQADHVNRKKVINILTEPPRLLRSRLRRRSVAKLEDTVSEVQDAKDQTIKDQPTHE
jgi:hypothetical protein